MYSAASREMYYTDTSLTAFSCRLAPKLNELTGIISGVRGINYGYGYHTPLFPM